MSVFSVNLTNRGVIRLIGEDRRAFLQGLISNDINLCTSEQPIYAALLTPQGKFLHDMFIVDSGDAFLIDCETARAEDLLKRLGMYKLRAKVVLENVSAEYSVWANSGNNPQDAITYTDPRLPQLGMRGIKKGKITEAEDFKIYDRHRLALGVPDGSRDMMIEKSTLLECNLDSLNAISWTKGCYVGQELTARMHYRGLAKKRLYPVKIEGVAPSSGATLQFNNQDAGEMRSSCDDLGLALLNIEKAQIAIRDNVPLICGESRLFVSNLPAVASVK